MTLPGLNMNMLNMNIPFGYNGCGSNFLATNGFNMNMLNMSIPFGYNGCGSNFLATNGFNMLGNILGGNACYDPCTGEFDYKAAVGFGLGQFGVKLATMILSSSLQNKQAQNAQPSLSSQIEDIDKANAEQAGKLGIEGEDVASHTIEQEYLDAETTANTNLDTAKTKSQNLAGEIAGLASEIGTLKAGIKTVPANATDEVKANIEAENKAINEKIAQIEAEKANGTIFNRNKDLDVSNLFNEKGEFNTNANVTLADIRELVDRFQNLKDGDEKLKVAKALAGLTNTQLASAGAKTSHYNMQEFAKKYVEENEK